MCSSDLGRKGRRRTGWEGKRMIERPRRLRTTASMRKLVRKTRPRPAQLVLPVFVGESPAEIGAMPGVCRHTVEQIGGVARSAAEAGLGGIMLFGVPDDADKAPPESPVNNEISRLADTRVLTSEHEGYVFHRFDLNDEDGRPHREIGRAHV